MLNTYRAVAGTALILLLGACAPQSSTPVDPVANLPSAGTVNGENVPVAVAVAFAKGRFNKPLAELSASERETMQTNLTQLYALAQEARKRGLTDDGETLGQLLIQEKNFLAQTLMRKAMDDNAVTDEQVRARYEEQVAAGEGRELSARHILVESQEEAVAVIAELDGGADFVELAKTRSTGPSGPNGGDLGWFGQGRMVEPFWQGALLLAPGEYSKEPVQTQFGWHVIKVEEMRERPFERAQAELRTKMQQQRMQDLMSSLTDKAVVDFASMPSAPAEQ